MAHREVKEQGMALVAALDAAQSRADVRLVEYDKLIDTVRAAATNGYATTGRRKVAAAYKYRAESTCVDAVRCGQDGVAVAIDRSDAGRASPLGLSYILPTWKPGTIKRRVAQAQEAARAFPGLVVITDPTRLTHTGRAGEAFAVTTLCRPLGSKAVAYSADGTKLGSAYWMELDGGYRYWQHASTVKEARALCRARAARSADGDPPNDAEPAQVAPAPPAHDPTFGIRARPGRWGDIRF